jgi:hypothetical protein
MLTGNYDTREELVEAVRHYYGEQMPVAKIAVKCGVTLKCVRGIITSEKMIRETRPILEPPKPMSIKPHELVLVADPCWREYCEDQGCPWHYAGDSHHE